MWDELPLALRDAEEERVSQMVVGCPNELLKM